MNSASSAERDGVLFGITAYIVWGLAPAYWKFVQAYPPIELLAWRVLSSALIACFLLAITGAFPAFREVWRSRRRALPVAGAAALLAANWLVFIYAVNTDRVIDTSLGYYLNPLISVVLGLLVLGETLRPLQWLAVGIAAIGVGQYVLVLGELPWIAVVLAISFGLYGLIRKTTPVETILGFGIEMTVLAIPCAILVAALTISGSAIWPTGELGMDTIVAASGLITAVPLLCFNAAAKRLPLVTVGILQYIAPSISLVLAVLAWGEPFERVHAITFGCVWIALAIFAFESLRQIQQRQAADRLAPIAAD